MTDGMLSGTEVDEAMGDVESDGNVSDPDCWELPDGRYIHSADFDIVVRMRKVLSFFEHRDEMNASVHLDQVRWSPITIEMENLVEEVTDIFAFTEDNEEDEDARTQ
jgi:hypothetical protein